MEGDAPELGPDGQPYFVSAVTRKKPVWPWVVGIVLGVVLLGILSVGFARHAELRRAIEGVGSGPPRPLREFEPQFPSVATVAGLLDPPVELTHEDVWRSPFTALLSDPQGAPALLYGNDGRYEWRHEVGKPGRAFATPTALKSVALLGRQETPYAAILHRTKRGESETVEGLAADGSSRWSWRGGDSPFLPWLATAYGKDGAPIGCVVGAGGKDGIVGLAADGTVSWRRPERFVMYEVATHPALPGWVASATGHLAIEPPDVATTTDRPDDAVADVTSEFTFVRHVVLFPSKRGDPAVVFGGNVKPLPNEEPMLARFDATPKGTAVSSRYAWRARPATSPQAVVLLEPPRAPRLFAVTTEGGDLLLLDEDGTVRANGRMPHSRAGAVNATYSLSAGPLGDRGWAITVELLEGTYLYRVHPEKLPAK